MNVMLSHLWLTGVSNRLAWDRSALHEIVHFGKWIFISSILGFLVISSDRLLLGGLVTPTVLGVYVIAFLIFSSVDQILSRITADVSLPAFSEISRHRPDDLKASYYRIHRIVASIAYLSAGSLMASGATLIGLLYDSRYHDAGWMLQILAAALLVMPFRLAVQYFLALGMPKIHTYLLLLQVAALFLFIPAGYYLFGLPGALWGIVAAHYSSLPATIFYMVKFGVFDLRSEVILYPLVLGAAVSALHLQPHR